MSEHRKPRERRKPVSREWLIANILIDQTVQCWNWQGRRNKWGYGCTRVKYKTKLAHRLAWELWRGPIPQDIKVLHRCDNPACINPDHLFLGTCKDNVLDAVRKGRHSSCKITLQQAISIRTIYKRGLISQSSIAERFGITQSEVSRILNRDTWREYA